MVTSSGRSNYNSRKRGSQASGIKSKSLEMMLEMDEEIFCVSSQVKSHMKLKFHT